MSYIEYDRPTRSELLQEAFEESLECSECGAGYSSIEITGSECLCNDCKFEWDLDAVSGGCGGCSPSGYCGCIMG